MITDWNIQSRGHGCEACGKTFADQESYHTVLVDEKAGLRRSDFCAGCWQEKMAGARSDRFVSCWQGVYQAPPPPTETIKKETAETLLRKLIELNDPEYMPAGYILAVMLERKRLLKVKEQIRRNGQRIFIYEHPASGDVFTITDPDLHLDQLEKVQRDVAHLLEHGFAAQAAAQNPDTPAPSADPQNPAATEEHGESGRPESLQRG